MLSSYRIQSTNNNKKRREKAPKTSFNNDSHHETDVKRPQMTSNDLAIPDTITKPKKRNKIFLKVGSMHENVEINEHFLAEIFHKNYLK